MNLEKILKQFDEKFGDEANRLLPDLQYILFREDVNYSDIKSHFLQSHIDTTLSEIERLEGIRQNAGAYTGHYILKNDGNVCDSDEDPDYCQHHSLAKGYNQALQDSITHHQKKLEEYKSLIKTV